MNNKLVLLIDDDQGILRLTESLLVAHGYDIIMASNGEEGVQFAKEHQPDVILLDLILPEKHGYEVCRILKEEERTKDIPVIIMTGSGLEEIVENEPDLRVSGIICKPFNFAQLNEVLTKVFSQG